MKNSSLNFNLPKQCTQSLDFLEETKCDGKGILIAILDSGVDPGAECMQTTSTGDLKVIDYLDATGSGIVDTSLTLKKDEKNQILSPFSGKTYDVSKMDCPSGDFQIGFKSLYDVYPAKLTRRVKEERKKKFEIMANTAMKEEMDDSVRKLYETLRSSYEDIGPFADCIVWKNGSEKYRCCCPLFDDTRVDLSTIPSLTNYRDEPKYLTFSSDCHMNYTVNIYDEGRRLSIVNPLSGHGTHVASIAAGHYPNTPEFNGVAPGCQIISIKISDSRLDSDGMETGTSVVKGLYLAKKYGADLINFSFGEPAHNCDEGIVRKILQNMWKEDNIIMCCSAGNSGPGFGTTGAPGSTYPENFGIGAFINRKMMNNQHYISPKTEDTEAKVEEEEEEEEEEEGEGEGDEKYHELDNETLHIWSSSGPSSSGWYGPDFIAPGSSVAGIPNFMLCRNSLKNGTSMSSPHALKCEGFEWTPHYIRSMVQSSARFIKGCHPYRQGTGLIQILDCLKLCRKIPMKDRVYYTVRIIEQQTNNGIYIRNYPGGAMSLSVSVSPVFHKTVTQFKKLKFEKHFRLVLRNKEAKRWIKVPSYFSLPNEQRSFQVTLDGKYFEECGLKGMYSTEILAFYRDSSSNDDDDDDDDDELKNPVPAFRVPVCVILPSVTPETVFTYNHSFGDHSKELVCHSGTGHYEDYLSSRRSTKFFEVPFGATFATIRIRSTEPMDPSKQVTFKYVSMLVIDNTRFPLTKGESYFRLWNDVVETRFDIVGLLPRSTLEVTILQHWKHLHTNITLEVQVEWKGVLLNDGQHTGLHFLSGANGPYQPILIQAPITKTKQRATLSGSLNRLRSSVLPSKREVVLAPKWDLERVQDPYTMRPMNYLFLEYYFKLPTSSSPVLSLGRVQDHLYEGEFPSIISLVYSVKTKALLGVLDFKAQTKKGCKLPDGMIRVLARISHHDQSFLKSFNPELYIVHSFSPSVKIEFWKTRHAAMMQKGTKMDKFFLYSRRPRKVFCSLNQSKLPISKLKAKGGDEFKGTISADSVTKSVLTFTVPPKTRKTAPPAPPSSGARAEKVKGPVPVLEKRVLDATLEYVKIRSQSLKEEGNEEEKEKLRTELSGICERLKKQCVGDDVILWDIFHVEVRLCESLRDKIKKLNEGISGVNVSELLLSIFNGMGVVPPKKKIDQEELEWCLCKKTKCLFDLFLAEPKATDEKTPKVVPQEEEQKKEKKKEEEEEEVEGEGEEEKKKVKVKEEEVKKKEEEEEEEDLKSEVLSSFREWKKWTHHNSTKKSLKNVVLEAKVEWKVNQKRSVSMGLIKKYIYRKEELFDMYLEMVGDLKWSFWEEYFRRSKLIKFPKEYKKIF